MTTVCLLKLRGLLTQLDRVEKDTSKDVVSRLSSELLRLGHTWPLKKEVGEEETKALERLASQLGKFPDVQQQEIVAAFRLLGEHVRRRMAEFSAKLNTWLCEAPHQSRTSPQKLADVLQGIVETPIMRCYKQCPDLDVKALFLWTMACVFRAVQGGSPVVHAHIATHPQALALAQQLAATFFVLPDHGSVLVTWHEGRLVRYDALLWRAGKSATERLKDRLQVHLIAAWRAGIAMGGHMRLEQELELQEWPMGGCPLARAFLGFVLENGPELGDLGHPGLGACPPHSLRPDTLRRILGRLEAFDIEDRVVRLRPHVVDGLGTDVAAALSAGPRIAAAAAALGAGPIEASANVSWASSRSMPQVSAIGSLNSTPGVSAGTDRAAAAGSRRGSVTSAPPGMKLVRRRIDWGNGRALLRLIRRGISAGDEEWNHSWYQFCWQRRVAAELEPGAATNAPSKDLLAEFVEKSLPALMKKEWARDLMYKVEGQGDDLPPESEDDVSGGRTGSGVGSSGTAGIVGGALQALPSDKRSSRSRGSSSGSDSSRSKQRRKKRRKKERKLGLMAFGDYFGRSQSDLHMAPEVMMMNQMMNMSMMMNSPLAMMGMGAPMMPHQMTMMQGGVKMKKDEKQKRVRVDDKPMQSPWDARDTRDLQLTREIRETGALRDRKRQEPPLDPRASPTAGAVVARPVPRDARLDWSRRKEAMIDADDL